MTYQGLTMTANQHPICAFGHALDGWLMYRDLPAPRLTSLSRSPQVTCAELDHNGGEDTSDIPAHKLVRKLLRFHVKRV